MTHPFKSKASDGRDVARKRYAEGGEVPSFDLGHHFTRANDTLSSANEIRRKRESAYKKDTESAMGSGVSGDSDYARGAKDQKKFEADKGRAIVDDGKWPVQR